MTNKKKGNAFTNNPIVRAIGVQKIVVVLVLILLLVFFSVKSSSFWTYASLLMYHGLYLLPGFLRNRRNLLPDYGRRGSFHRNRNVLLRAGRRLSDYKTGYAGYRGNSGDYGMGILVGLVNGLIVSKGGHAPFLATLCTMMIVRVWAPSITGGSSITWPIAGTPEGWTRNLFKFTLPSGTKIPLGFSGY